MKCSASSGQQGGAHVHGLVAGAAVRPVRASEDSPVQPSSQCHGVMVVLPGRAMTRLLEPVGPDFRRRSATGRYRDKQCREPRHEQPCAGTG